MFKNVYVGEGDIKYISIDFLLTSDSYFIQNFRYSIFLRLYIIIFDNISNLPLTTNDDGISIESVKLPNWANNAREMSDILLKLMQSDYVQKNINHWI